MSRSSSGPGRRPLKAEITGSNPVRDVFFFEKLPNFNVVIVFGKSVTYYAGNNQHQST